MKVIYLNVNERKAPEVLEIEDKLETFYKLIDCSTVDIVTREIGGKPFSIICDDEGLFVEKPTISALKKEHKTELVGNLIITGMPDDDGELTGLTDEEIRTIEANTKMIIQFNHNTEKAQIIDSLHNVIIID